MVFNHLLLGGESALGPESARLKIEGSVKVDPRGCLVGGWDSMGTTMDRDVCSFYTHVYI